MNPRNEHESLLDWVIRWLEYRETRRVVQAQLGQVTEFNRQESEAL